jgi:tetratricopeptide (TPR) repeat protein/tRNA A-37 threonylcarbamoyl transferase component Bud32
MALDRLFEAALSLPVGEREAFLLQQAGDERLAAEALALLQAAAEEDPAQQPLTVHHLMEALGTVFLDSQLPAHYRVGNLVGEGGMGIVYEGVDERDGSKVAIKILHPEQARHPGRLARFHREAEAMAVLDHPGIVRIREAGSGPGIHYLAMEFLEGETLRQRLQREGPLAQAQVLEYGLAISAALDAAHRAGVTHRDLKPENVILTPTGPKVLDFGLAHLNELESLQRTTLEGALSGTVAYLAPEQIEGSSGTVQTDIFALGVVLYEAATGAPPFQKSNPIATARAITGESPDYTRAPPALRPVLQRCLEKDSSRRYASCGLVYADLEKVRAGIRVTANRRPVPSALPIAAAVCLAAVAVWWSYHRGSASPNPRAVTQVEMGKYHFSRRTQASILKSAELFREAGRIDPKYAEAHAWLANSLSLLPEYGINEAGNAEEGRQAARRAIARNPRLSNAHTALGWILFSRDWNWAEAEREFRKGVELAPNDALPHQRYGLALISRSRFSEAETELTRAHSLEPLSISPMINLAELWFYAHRFDREEAQLQAILDRDPEWAVARAMLAKVESLTGRGKEAIEEMKRLLALPEGGSWCPELVEVYALDGQPQAGLQQVKNCGVASIPASGFFALGQKERAMEVLERNYRTRDTTMAFLNVDPSFDLVRGDPDFQRLLRKMGF